MKRAWVLLSLLLASNAHAAADYAIRWDCVTYRSLGSTIGCHLVENGGGYFRVNGLPLPTWEYPSTFKTDGWGNEHLTMGAKLSSALLTVGQNRFHFGVFNSSGDPTGNIVDHEVNLYNAASQKLAHLFAVQLRGVDFEGDVDKNLSLRQVDPKLADALAQLEDAIRDAFDTAVKTASENANLARDLDQLSQLLDDVDALLAKGFDQLTPEDLAALLAKYPNLPKNVQDALVQLLRDLQADIEALRTEIDRVVGEFRTQIDGTDPLGAQPTPGGFDSRNPGSFSPQTNPDSIPVVSVPDVLGRDDFDDKNDPYAAYADEVLAQLDAVTSGDTVTNKDGFLNVYETWRENQRALERALKARATVSQREWGAFLRAQQRVFPFARRYLDGADWFKDAPVPQELRNLVDLVVAARFANHAKAIKSGLNRWGGAHPTPRQQIMIEVLLGIGGAAESLDEAAAQDPTAPATLKRWLDGAVTGVKEAGKVGIGFTPVGDFIDACEVFSGWESCIPGGTALTTTGRVLSGAGLVIGSGTLWRSAGKWLALTGKKVMHTTADFVDNMVGLAAAERREMVSRLKNLDGDAVAGLFDITGKEIRTLLDGLGDLAVDKLAKRLKGAGLKELHAYSRVFDKSVLSAFSGILEQSGQFAVCKLPLLKGKTLVDVERILTDAGMKKLHVRPDQTTWVSQIATDLSVVRVSSGTNQRPFLHLKKEISAVYGQTEVGDIVCKVTDGNVPAAALPKAAREELNKWFHKQSLGNPTADERNALEDAWGELTHITLR